MPRKLKTYQTSLGFYDLAIAAPSMKAALEAWGAGSNLFHHGFAKETDDPDAITATMAKPGVVLKRPAGSGGRFAEHAGLPDLEDKEGKSKVSRHPQPKRRGASKIKAADSRKAAAAYEREQKRHDVERRREEAASERPQAKRGKRSPKGPSELDDAQREHEERSGKLEADRRAIEKRIEAEDARWESQREKLRDALRSARE